MKKINKYKMLRAVSLRMTELKKQGYENLLKKTPSYWSESLMFQTKKIGEIEISLFPDSDQENSGVRIVISYDNGTLLSSMCPITFGRIVEKN